MKFKDKIIALVPSKYVPAIFAQLENEDTPYELRVGKYMANKRRVTIYCHEGSRIHFTGIVAPFHNAPL